MACWNSGEERALSEFSSTRSGSKARVILEPQLTRSQVQGLQPILSGEIKSGATEFEFDCAALCALDGSGVALFIALEERLKGKGEVRLTNANSAVQELLSHLRLADRLHVDVNAEVSHG